MQAPTTQTHSKFNGPLGIAAVAAVAIGSAFFAYAQAPNPNFLGGQPTKMEIKTPPQVVSFDFPAGVRTKWHSHAGGQIVMVESGVGLHQVKGQPIQELKAGEVVYAGPGVVHWHGAAPDRSGVQYNITRGDITWLDDVTDAQYKAKIGIPSKK